MSDEQTVTTRRGAIGKPLAIVTSAIVAVSAAGVVLGSGHGVETSGSGAGGAVVSCPGGMSRLGHQFDREISVFPGDPDVETDVVYTVAEDFFRVEAIRMGTHAGTHLDVPAHFIEGGRTVDELTADEFVWPAYKIDVRGMAFTDNFVEVADILAYEALHGEIAPGSLVVLQTGAEPHFGLDGAGDDRHTKRVGNPRGHMRPLFLADNTDDMFDFVNPGFSGAAVQWLFDNRAIDGVGSDAYGPDAATDEFFDATYTTLFNDGVALVALANLDSVSVNSDVIMASVVSLADGSGFSTDPIACHGTVDEE